MWVGFRISLCSCYFENRELIKCNLQSKEIRFRLTVSYIMSQSTAYMGVVVGCEVWYEFTIRTIEDRLSWGILHHPTITPLTVKVNNIDPFAAMQISTANPLILRMWISQTTCAIYTNTLEDQAYSPWHLHTDGSGSPSTIAHVLPLKLLSNYRWNMTENLKWIFLVTLQHCTVATCASFNSMEYSFL